MKHEPIIQDEEHFAWRRTVEGFRNGLLLGAILWALIIWAGIKIFG